VQRDALHLGLFHYRRILFTCSELFLLCSLVILPQPLGTILANHYLLGNLTLLGGL
jgi:hypothetical protein